MNTSIIIDDIRKRSIKIQRDKILEKIRQEEELEATTLPRKIIMEAEERAREKIALQGWKRNLSFIAIFLGAGYIIYRILMTGRQKLSRKKTPPVTSSFAIQTETVEEEKEENDVKPKPSRVTFNVEPKDEEESLPREIRKLKTDYPRHWKGFQPNYEFPWLTSNVTGQMKFDFYNSDLKIGIDMITAEMLEYPNVHFTTQEDFENSVYDRQLKLELSDDHSITYKVINLDLEMEEYDH